MIKHSKSHTRAGRSFPIAALITLLALITAVCAVAETPAKITIAEYGNINPEDSGIVIPQMTVETYKDLCKDIHYPEEAAKAHKQGQVRFLLNVLSDGTLDSIRVVKSVDPKLEEEGIRAIKKNMKVLSPGTVNGIPTEMECFMSIFFNLQRKDSSISEKTEEAEPRSYWDLYPMYITALMKE